MLCWGNLVWVPFTFTIQAQYLVTPPARASALGHGGARRPRPGRLRDLPRRESTKHRFRRGSGGARLGPAARLHHDRERQPAARVRLVGHGAAPELPGRPRDGAGLVPALPVRPPAAVLLRSVLRRSCWCTASGATTRCAPRSTAPAWEAYCRRVRSGESRAGHLLMIGTRAEAARPRHAPAAPRPRRPCGQSPPEASTRSARSLTLTQPPRL